MRVTEEQALAIDEEVRTSPHLFSARTNHDAECIRRFAAERFEIPDLSLEELRGIMEYAIARRTKDDAAAAQRAGE